MTFQVQSLKLLCLTVSEEMHLQKKIHYLTFDLDLGAKVTRNIAQYTLNHVSHSGIKFEFATSNGLGGDARKDGRTDRQTDEQRTDFDTKLI